MEKQPLVPSHTCLGLSNKPNKEIKSHSFFTGRGAKPMPYVMWVNDYCNDENELEPYNPEKDNTSFLKTLKKNIHN